MIATSRAATLTMPATVAARRRDDGLSARFARREPRAVDEVYARHADRLLATAYRLLGDRDLASEAVQRAMLRAWQRADTYDHERPLEPWLHAICRRTAIDTYRSHRRHPTPMDEAEMRRQMPPFVAELDDTSVVADVREAIDRLPDGEREVMRSAYLDGLSYGEVADRLGVPVGTIKSRSHRAHRRLAAQLSHLRDRHN